MGTPEGWHTRRVGDIAELRRGFTWKKDQERGGPGHGRIPVLRIPNVQERLELDDLIFLEGVSPEDLTRYRASAGFTLLVGSNGNPARVGNCVYVDRNMDFVFASFLIAASPADRREIAPEYLFRILASRTVQDAVTESVQGSTGLKNINLGTLREVEVRLPPLPEQRKIAAILSSLDETIEKTEAVIDQLQVVKKAMMEELLTRGMPGRHTRFKHTEIGEIPEGWEVVAVGDVCERMFVGIAQAATHAYVSTGGVPIVRTTNVKPGRIERHDMLRISDEFALQMASKALRAGDVLSARTGYPGVSALVDAELDGAQCFTLLVSRPGPRLLGGYLMHLMNSPLGKEIVRQGQAGGAQQNLNVTVFERALIALPTTAEQAEIVSLLDLVATREDREKDAAVALARLKSHVAAELLSGDLRVTPDEAPA